MRRNIPQIFAILLLTTLILFSGCVSQPAVNHSTGQNTGLAQISEGSPYINFDEAQLNLKEYRSGTTNESTGINTIYYLHGTNVDVSGNASSWIFGVRHSGETELLSYDRSGWIKIPWNAPALSEEINFDRIVSPGSLFSKNTAVIIGNPSQAIPERRDLDLIGGIYTLTITSGNKDRILTFNATTGELITKQ